MAWTYIGRQEDGAVSGDDLADDPGGGLRLEVEVADDRLGVVFGDDEDQSDAHVEDAVHLGDADRAESLEPGEDLGYGPGPATELDGAALGEDARGVVDEAAAGDMSDAVDDPLDPIV